MRQRARVDRNHGEIVKALRQAGCAVCDLSRMGGGVPDLLVSRSGETWCLEVKDGQRKPSERRLTPDEADWHAASRGRVLVVNSVEEALNTL